MAQETRQRSYTVTRPSTPIPAHLYTPTTSQRSTSTTPATTTPTTTSSSNTSSSDGTDRPKSRRKRTVDWIKGRFDPDNFDSYVFWTAIASIGPYSGYIGDRGDKEGGPGAAYVKGNDWRGIEKLDIEHREKYRLEELERKARKLDEKSRKLREKVERMEVKAEGMREEARKSAPKK